MKNKLTSIIKTTGFFVGFFGLFIGFWNIKYAVYFLVLSLWIYLVCGGER